MNKNKNLKDVIIALNGEDGCPWDRKQTIRTIRQFLLEESYELLEAMENPGSIKHRDELGDLLFQIYFQAHIVEKSGGFNIEDVETSICTKLVERHPHVFSSIQSDITESIWEKNKMKARGSSSIMDDLPKTLPALTASEKIQRRAASIGFDWPDYHGPRGKVDEELAELDDAFASGEDNRIEEEMGDLLFSVSNLARHLGCHPEITLHKTNNKFRQRFQLMETLAKEDGIDLGSLDLDAQDEYWVRAKNILKSAKTT
ncbi:nucleoside triphosphate pyrophosphohydrolase [Myxococcota bacterium]|nr:nucleoside triphosphate pyrophosphohydrolase [Myxococcota bacterium]MBU1379793.1 nucleoside triphosphate pyrophosphohydrolase [Myxococcota bacterium]MBU1497594.1 nucleoside triphosphate pyrophosphohydrolase [Myxococcota bacterium]